MCSKMSSNNFDKINDDILCQILSKLPAKEFAFASCVSSTWNRISKKLLTLPKLVAAMSSEKNLEIALDNIVKEVLSNLIKPQFVIVCFTIKYNSKMVHEYMKNIFGESVAIITSLVKGVIGKDVNKDEGLNEVTANEVEYERMEREEEKEEEDEEDDIDEMSLGIVLIVGWFPDMKVDAIPLLCSDHPTRAHTFAFDEFSNDIKKYNMDVAESTYPAAIIIFGDKQAAHKNELLQKMDREFGKETKIIGHFGDMFDHQSLNFSKRGEIEAVALVFARNKYKDPEIGTTHFHIPCMSCVSQIGSENFYVVSISDDVNRDNTNVNHLIARSSRDGRTLDGHSLESVEGVCDRLYFDDYYIGIERKQPKKRCMKDEASSSSAVLPIISLHSIEKNQDDGQGSLVVRGKYINKGDTFHVYKSDFKRGLSMYGVITPEHIQKNCEVFGGVVFANMSSVVAQMTRDCLAYSFPFIELFEGVPLGGLFTKSIAKRGTGVSAWKDGEYHEVDYCATNHKGLAFLVLSFTQP